MKDQNSGARTLCIDAPSAPPEWALLQRELVRVQGEACELFYNRYFDERGYLICVPRWGADDGPDDAIENLTGWPILHAVGGPNSILHMYKAGWEGHLRQYTEAKTVDVPFARDGMYYKEFPVMLDWLHNGETLTVFNLQGLSDPCDPQFERRVRRYAGFYMNEDPQAPNYDPEHKIIRSMFNGSRGPLLRKATALDWAGDPIEIEGRFKPAHGERNFEEMLAHFEEYTDVVGDHPLNLAATTLALNAYMATGEAKYKQWLLEYVDAWVERAKANSGILPSNIGLDGSIGGECGGKWYGGCYGWGFSVVVPQTGKRADRNIVYRGIAGFGNALLLTGDRHYIDVWRATLKAINANSKTIDGQKMYPHMYGDDGWYGYRAQPYSQGALEVYCWSMDRNDLQFVPENPWITYLEGNAPDYPVETLRQEFETIRRKVDEIRRDSTTPDTRMSDDMLRFNPAADSCLTQLMLGGVTPRQGDPLHCRLRYFNPGERRAGVPEDVAALVETLTDTEVTLTLVNISPIHERTLMVQGGAYGEHKITCVTANGQKHDVDDSFVTVCLAPAAVSRMVINMKRYVNQPTFAFPWDRI